MILRSHRISPTIVSCVLLGDHGIVKPAGIKSFIQIMTKLLFVLIFILGRCYTHYLEEGTVKGAQALKPD